MTIGQRIKEARLNAGFTQKMLADELGVSFVNVSQWENGARNPKIQTLQKIANALNVTVGYLQGYDSLNAKKLVDALKNGDKNTVETLLNLQHDTIISIGEQSASAILQSESEELKAGIINTLVSLQVSRSIAEKLVNKFLCLNETGQKKAIENVEDLAKIPEYQKKDEPGQE